MRTYVTSHAIWQVLYGVAFPHVSSGKLRVYITWQISCYVFGVHTTDKSTQAYLLWIVNIYQPQVKYSLADSSRWQDINLGVGLILSLLHVLLRKDAHIVLWRHGDLSRAIKMTIHKWTYKNKQFDRSSVTSRICIVPYYNVTLSSSAFNSLDSRMFKARL